MVLEARVQTVGEGIVIDLDNEVVRDVAGAPIELRNQAFEVLRYLVERPGQLVTKDELMQAVWPDVAVTDDSLVQCIHEIRRALGDADRVILKTVARRGYRLVQPAPDIPRASEAGRRPLVLMAAAILIALALAGIAWWITQRSALPAEGPSIAVLPFDNLSADPDQRYFADGMTEDLITDLSKISGVMVIARNSVWPYRDKPADIHQVAEQLSVRYLLEGSVRREGDQVRINAQLIDTRDGHHLWANRYDGTFSNVFKLQDSVIANIVSALAVELTGDEVAAASEIETTDPHAYDAYLRGMAYLHLDTPEDTSKAIALFEKAVSLDPGYSRGYAAIAAAQQRVVLSIWYTTAGSGLDNAINSLVANLAKAMEKPTSLSYSVQAVWDQQAGRNERALENIDKALALAPRDADVHVSRARVLGAVGRAPEAEAELRLAMRLDPVVSPLTLRLLSIAKFEQADYQGAIDLVTRIVSAGADTTDDQLTLVSALGHLGRREGVQRGIERYNELALQASWDPMTVQEAQWYWNNNLLSYHRPYVDKLVEGLRLAGLPEGAGMDIPRAKYQALVKRVHDAEFDVEGATEVDVATAKALRDRGVLFVDVRAHPDFANGHVPGAVNLSLVIDLSKETLAKIAGPDDEIVFYCHSKYCDYSAYASAKAVIWGYKRVYRFSGGFPEWVNAGYPVEVSPKPSNPSVQ